MGTRRGTRLIGGATAVLAVTAIGGMALAGDDLARLDARLSGTNEVPAADPDGSGRARINISADGDEVCFRVNFDRTGTPNRGHIHVGAAGVNGGIVVPLFELAGMPADERNDALEAGRLEQCVPADPATLAAIAADPDGYYVNLHNGRFPAGAIRGQLRD